MTVKLTPEEQIARLQAESDMWYRAAVDARAAAASAEEQCARAATDAADIASQLAAARRNKDSLALTYATNLRNADAAVTKMHKENDALQAMVDKQAKTIKECEEKLVSRDTRLRLMALYAHAASKTGHNINPDMLRKLDEPRLLALVTAAQNWGGEAPTATRQPIKGRTKTPNVAPVASPTAPREISDDR